MKELWIEDGKLMSCAKSAQGSVVVPAGVRIICDMAFSDCAQITSIILPDGVTSIGNRAFYNCKSLRYLSIPESVSFIGKEAFFLCLSLNVSIFDNAFYLGSEQNPFLVLLYGKSASTKCLVNNQTKVICDKAFLKCKKLEYIVIPPGVVHIGNGVFDGCENLSAIIVQDDNLKYSSVGNCLVEIDKKILIAGCKNSVIPADGSVEKIAAEAFKRCAGLRSITIPETIKYIGKSAFEECDNLSRIKIPDSVSSIPSSAFCRCRNLSCVVLENGISDIGDSAFSGCVNLSHITVPDSVKKIGDHAFYGCSELGSIHIGKRVKEIGESSFAKCDKLASIYIDDLATWCCTIFAGDTHCFKNAHSLFVDGVPVTDLVIPDGVEHIGFIISSKYDFLFKQDDDGNEVKTARPYEIDYDRIGLLGGAFENARFLQSVTFPKSLKFIATSAFAGCCNLQKIVYKGSVDEWQAITKELWWATGVPCRRVLCNDGEYKIEDDESRLDIFSRLT